MSHSQLKKSTDGSTGGNDQREPARNDWSIGSSWVTLGVLVLAVVILSRVGLVANSPAIAEMVISDAGYTMMTTNGGNDEILVLVDSREETVLVYRVDQTGGLMLLESESLSGVFTRARAQVLGSP